MVTIEQIEKTFEELIKYVPDEDKEYYKTLTMDQKLKYLRYGKQTKVKNFAFWIGGEQYDS